MFFRDLFQFSMNFGHFESKNKATNVAGNILIISNFLKITLHYHSFRCILKWKSIISQNSSDVHANAENNYIGRDEILLWKFVQHFHNGNKRSQLNSIKCQCFVKVFLFFVGEELGQSSHVHELLIFPQQ